MDDENGSGAAAIQPPDDAAPAITAVSVTRRAWEWMRTNPVQSLGLLAGTLAFLRLVAVSHARLATARVLLDHADLASLSGGLVLSAAILWIPVVTAWITYMALAPITGGSASNWIGTVGFVIVIGGQFALWDVLDLSLSGVPHGGPNFATAAVVLGIGIGAFLHPVLRDIADPSQRSEEQQRLEATALAMMRADRPARPPSRWSVRIEHLLGYFSRAAGFALGGALVMAVLFTVLIVLSEPSQPPENITVRGDAALDTRTVHVLDDTGDEWLVMRRDDRRVVSIAAADVTDRYLCSITPVPDEPTELVQRNVVDPGRGLEPPDPPVPDAVKRIAADALDGVDDAGDWIDAVTDAPPPCELEWTTAELDLVRAELGVTCRPLSGCTFPDD